MKPNEEIRQIAETVGAIQDTIRVHADNLGHIRQHLYAMIISLDLIFMELVSGLPEEERRDILQNQFDESKSGAENDLVALERLAEYVERRTKDCKEFIKSDHDLNQKQDNQEAP